MALRRPRTCPSLDASHLRNTLTSRPCRSPGSGRAGRNSPASRIAAQIPSASSASRITLWPMRYRPPTPRALPTTTICARSSSTPDEQDATDEYSARLCRTSPSDTASISRSAIAIPSAVVPLDRSIDSWVCSVHTVAPRAFASRMVWMVSSGVFVCT